MTEQRHFPPEQIQKAAEALKAHLPEYNALLSFYERLFTAQENSKLQISLEPVVIRAEVLDLKRREQLPLVEISEFAFDASAGGDLLVQICAIIRTADNEMALSAEKTAAAVGEDLEIESLFQHLLAGNDAYYDKTADRIGCDKNTLAFIAYNSIKPSLAVCADQLSTYITDQTEWQSGYCPICGNLPAIAVLDKEGRRSMACSFCWHQWPMPRILCPFCGNSDGKKRNYLYSDTEKAFRVDCCEACRKYIKVVDQRAAGRAIYPPLEQVASLHLDINARQAGFDTGIPLHLPAD